MNIRLIRTGIPISESVDLAYELYSCVFRRVRRELMKTRVVADKDVPAGQFVINNFVALLRRLGSPIRVLKRVSA